LPSYVREHDNDVYSYAIDKDGADFGTARHARALSESDRSMLNVSHDPQRSIRYTVDEGFVLSRCIDTGTILEVCSVSISSGGFGYPGAATTYQRRSL
jgi:hypothetical protein